MQVGLPSVANLIATSPSLRALIYALTNVRLASGVRGFG